MTFNNKASLNKMENLFFKKFHYSHGLENLIIAHCRSQQCFDSNSLRTIFSINFKI